MSRLAGSGGTDLAAGLITALELAMSIESQHKVIVLVSDAESQANELGDALFAINAVHVPVIAVAVENAASATLARIAKATGGRALTLDDPRGIEALCDELAFRRR